MKSPRRYIRHAPRRRTFYVDDPGGYMDYPGCGFKCRNCQLVKPRKDFVFRVMHGYERLHVWCKRCRETKPQHIPNGYVRMALRAGTRVPATAKIPKWLVELKRRQIQMKRMVKERKRA
jgi:hypothetical protein